MNPLRRTGFNFEWGGENFLTFDEIWPDGDAPKNPTREDVIARLNEWPSLSSLLSDWCLNTEGLEIDGKDSGLR